MRFNISNSPTLTELFGIDGEPIEIEWNISQDTSLEILQKIQKDLHDRNIEPENLEDRIIFMSMFNDRMDQEKTFRTMHFKFRKKKKNCAKRFSRGHWTYEKKWYGTLSHTLEGKWVSTATQMVERFKETNHPVFKSISALSRGILKRTKNRDTTHFNADASNTELLFRTIHSANQLSIYGAVSTWCEEFGLKPNERDDF